jgi:REP element-mobilizing transposase RayT
MDAEDHGRYLEIMSHYKERYHFFLYGYALMGNHVHLLMETRGGCSAQRRQVNTAKKERQ